MVKCNSTARSFRRDAGLVRWLLLVVAIKAGKTKKPHCSLFYDLVSLRSTASLKEATPPTTPLGKKRRWM